MIKKGEKARVNHSLFRVAIVCHVEKEQAVNKEKQSECRMS